MITRRNFCAGLAGLVAAPYVIREAGVLMPVRDRSLGIVYAIKSTEGKFPLVAGKKVFSSGTAEGPLGMIYPFPGKPPKGWLPFDGRTITREQHPELFKLGTLDNLQDVRLTMSGCVPALEAAPPYHNGGWWLADAQARLQTG